jgi:membrane protease YdiL (CAAX protease family)
MNNGQYQQNYSQQYWQQPIVNNYQRPQYQVNSQDYMIYSQKYGYISAKSFQKKKIIRDVTIFSLLALSTLIVSVLLVLILALIWGPSGIYYDLVTDNDYYNVLNLFVTVLSTGMPFALYLAIMKPDVSQLFKFEKHGFGWGLMFALAGVAIILALNYPIGWLEQLFSSVGINAGSNQNFTADSPLSGILVFISVAVMPPIYEEFAYRGVIMSSLRKYGDFFALFASASIFGMMHMNILNTPFAIVSGLVFGYVYMQTENMLANISIHFLNNAVAVLPITLSAFISDEDLVNNISSYVYFALIGIGCIALAVLFVNKKLKKNFEKPKMIISSDEKLKCAAVNPGMILLVIAYAIMSLLSMMGVSL